MSRHLIDQDHTRNTARRAAIYTRLDRIGADEAGHPKIKMLTRRSRRAGEAASGLKQFLRIARGNLA